jgi:hypothetical protein
MTRPNYHAAGGMPFRPRARAEYSGVDLSKQPVPPEPHPELGVEIVQLHTWLVESAVYWHGTDVAAISAAVCLPPWTVGRALHRLGLAGPPEPTPKNTERRRVPRSPKLDQAHAWLRDLGRPATTHEIANGCQLGSVTGLTALFRCYPEMFRPVGSKRRGGNSKARSEILWEAVTCST